MWAFQMEMESATNTTYHNNILIANYIIQAISNQLYIHNELHQNRSINTWIFIFREQIPMIFSITSYASYIRVFSSALKAITNTTQPACSIFRCTNHSPGIQTTTNQLLSPIKFIFYTTTCYYQAFLCPTSYCIIRKPLSPYIEIFTVDQQQGGEIYKTQLA